MIDVEHHKEGILEFIQRHAGEIIGMFFVGDPEKSNYVYWYTDHIRNTERLYRNPAHYAALLKELLAQLSAHPLIAKVDYGGFLLDHV